jgi:hypothetical protein
VEIFKLCYASFFIFLPHHIQLKSFISWFYILPRMLNYCARMFHKKEDMHQWDHFDADHSVKVCWILYISQHCIRRQRLYLVWCSIRLYLQLFVGWFMSYLRYLYLFAHSVVQNILCCVFVLFFYCLFVIL